MYVLLLILANVSGVQMDVVVNTRQFYPMKNEPTCSSFVDDCLVVYWFCYLEKNELSGWICFNVRPFLRMLLRLQGF